MLTLLGLEAWTPGLYISLLLPSFFLSAFLLKLYRDRTIFKILQKCPNNLTGKTAVVTGANSGIGKAVASELARRGFRVILACRSKTRGQEALEDIQKATGSKQLLLRELDLSSLASIQSFSHKLLQEEPQIHLLVNNAAIHGLTEKTSNGLDLILMTNYLGPFLLTNLLLKGLLQSGSARVVNVSSYRQEFGQVDEQSLTGTGSLVTPSQKYDSSKLLLLIFTAELARRLQGTGITVNSVEPGIVKTGIFTNLSWWIRLIFWFLGLFLQTPEQGAVPVVYLSLAKELDGISGKFFNSSCRLTLPADPAQDPQVALRLWNTSAKVTNLEKMVKRE